MKEKTPLVILGTHMLALVVADMVSEIEDFKLCGFVENLDRTRTKEKLENQPVLWIDELSGLSKVHKAVCALSTTFRDRFVQQALTAGLSFATLVHPSAEVSSKSKLGDGCIISPGVVIAPFTTLDSHVFVNRGVCIGHHTRIGSYTTIQPGANIAGACEIGSHVYIGMGANIMDRLSIGSRSVVGAGALITKPVPNSVQVMGLPAKIVKRQIKGK